MAREIADSIVVGGGIAGLLTAWELAQAGQQVVLFDGHTIGAHDHGQASWAGAGILSPLYPWRYPTAVNQLSNLSLRIYDELLPRLGRRNRSEYIESGMIILDKSDATTARAWATKNPSVRHTPELMLSSDVAQYELGVRAPENGALRLSKVAQVRPPKLLRELRKALRKMSVTVVEKQPVLGLAWDGDTLAGVRTGNSVWRANNVVICAGAKSAELLAPAGVTLPVHPVRGEMLRLQGSRNHKPLQHIVMYKSTYLVPRSDGSILVGATMEDSDSTETTGAAREALLSAAEVFYPNIRQLKQLNHWSGLRPGTHDNVPYIGPVPDIENLYVNTGHYRSGLTIAPAAARLIRQIILEQKPSLDVAQFSLAREAVDAAV